LAKGQKQDLKMKVNKYKLLVHPSSFMNYEGDKEKRAVTEM
jgi:hypothetical protein